MKFKNLDEKTAKEIVRKHLKTPLNKLSYSERQELQDATIYLTKKLGTDGLREFIKSES